MKMLKFILKDKRGHSKLVKLPVDELCFEPDDREVGIMNSFIHTADYVVFDNGECQNQDGEFLGMLQPIGGKDFYDEYMSIVHNIILKP